MTKTGYSIMTSARSVCMSVSRAFGAGLCGVGSITLNGGKGRTRETKDQESGSKFIKFMERANSNLSAFSCYVVIVSREG